MSASVLSTVSALLAFSTIIIAQIHHFDFYDPTLLKIFGVGFLLSLAGFVSGVCGIWRRNILQWHAPISAVGMLAFWFLMAVGE